MGIRRQCKHLVQSQWRVRHIFKRSVLERIEQVIAETELTHCGQVRFVVEGALDGVPLFHDQPSRERALDFFAHLHIWDTAYNNGVLIYLLLADHRVEIVADRGINQFVGGHIWEEICHEMESEFARGRYEEGVIRGIEAVSMQLAKYYPAQGPHPNELPDWPVVVRR